MVARLYAMRDTMQPKYWRLVYAEPGETIYIGAEGECSKNLYRTGSEALYAGIRRYRERGMIWRSDKMAAPQFKEI